MAYKHFKSYSKQDILSLTSVRKFETKVGESIQSLDKFKNLETAIQKSDAQYVLLGICEDIGVKANYGIAGTHTAWKAFLAEFLNVQSNDFFTGEDILLAGHFDFSDLSGLIAANAKNEEESIAAYRHAVQAIDDEVEALIKLIAMHDKIPIVIGGGHNNAYPLIKGTAKGLHKSGSMPLAQINCINLDAHTGYRATEGRHSGNSFRYAEEHGYLLKYCVIGVHEGYIPQNVWIDMVNNPFMDLITFEDIFLHEKRTFMQAVAHATDFAEDNFTGIELDLDSVENALTSDTTPSGITALHARQYINFAASDIRVAYLHISEGASMLEDGRVNATSGKLISYLVTDFVKSH